MNSKPNKKPFADGQPERMKTMKTYSVRFYKIDGYLSPMYDGGRLRYETQEVYDMMFD